MNCSMIHVAAALAVLSVTTRLCAQDAFQNLDFESPTFIPSPPWPPHTVSLAAALPRWTGYLGTNSVRWACHNTKSLSGAGITINGPDYPVPSPMHGHHYVQLKAGIDPFGSSASVDAELAQTGTLPVDAKSIRLWTLSPVTSSWGVTFDGRAIPMVNLGTDSKSELLSHLPLGRGHFEFLRQERRTANPRRYVR